MEFSQTTFVDNPEWNQIVFNSTNTQVEIGSFDKDGDIEFFVTQGSESTSFYLNKENIQQLITHLQNVNNFY
jgi:hypothetical protein